VLDQFYAGPETQVYGGDGYRQLRFGAHITSMKTGATEWSAAGGWAVDSDQRSSPYVRLGVMTRQ
jgi:Cellulose biosynthesis protein BcsS